MHEDMQMSAIQLPAEVASLWFTSLTPTPPLSVPRSPPYGPLCCFGKWGAMYTPMVSVLVLLSHICPSLLQSTLIDMKNLSFFTQP